MEVNYIFLKDNTRSTDAGNQTLDPQIQSPTLYQLSNVLLKVLYKNVSRNLISHHNHIFIIYRETYKNFGVGVRCSHKYENAAFICEDNSLELRNNNIKQHSDKKNLLETEVSEIAKESNRNSLNLPIFMELPDNLDDYKVKMTSCPDGHVTHEFLVCDVSSSCHAQRQSSIQSCFSSESKGLFILTLFAIKNRC